MKRSICENAVLATSKFGSSFTLFCLGPTDRFMVQRPRVGVDVSMKEQLRRNPDVHLALGMEAIPEEMNRFRKRTKLSHTTPLR